MDSIELFKLLKKQISKNLSGKLTHDGVIIKWEYDGFDDRHNVDDLDEYLYEICDSDIEIIEEFLDDEGIDDFIISQSEINDSFIFFYIEN